MGARDVNDIDETWWRINFWRWRNARLPCIILVISFALSPRLSVLQSRTFFHFLPPAATLACRCNKRMSARARFIFIKELIFIYPRADSFLLVHLPPLFPFSAGGSRWVYLDFRFWDWRVPRRENNPNRERPLRFSDTASFVLARHSFIVRSEMDRAIWIRRYGQTYPGWNYLTSPARCSLHLTKSRLLSSNQTDFDHQSKGRSTFNWKRKRGISLCRFSRELDLLKNLLPPIHPANFHCFVRSRFSASRSPLNRGNIRARVRSVIENVRSISQLMTNERPCRHNDPACTARAYTSVITLSRWLLSNNAFIRPGASSVVMKRVSFRKRAALSPPSGTHESSRWPDASRCASCSPRYSQPRLSRPSVDKLVPFVRKRKAKFFSLPNCRKKRNSTSSAQKSGSRAYNTENAAWKIKSWAPSWFTRCDFVSWNNALRSFLRLANADEILY